jgi:1-acyl-sn-glycerol-3-phosphate acyltransferase
MKRSIPVLYNIFKFIFICLFKISNRFKVIGKENIPSSGPALIVANHVSGFDPLILGSGTPRQIKYIAKEELFRIPIIGSLLSAWGAIRIKRGRSDREAISKSIEILGNGHLMGIFIEGKRNTKNPDQMLKPQHGAAMLALRTGVPVIPTALINTHKIFRSFRKVKIVFGTPITFKEEPGVDKKELYDRISNKLVQEIMNLKKGCPKKPNNE